MKLEIKGVPFKSYGINGKRGGSVYDAHNICTRCMLKYPKDIHRCSNQNPKCSHKLKTRSWNSRAKFRITNEVKRIG